LGDEHVQACLLQRRAVASAEGGDGDVLQGGFVARAFDELGGERRCGHFVDEKADDALAAGGDWVGFAAAVAQLLSGFLHAAAGGF
jgi:hypothetical protein